MSEIKYVGRGETEKEAVDNLLKESGRTAVDDMALEFKVYMNVGTKVYTAEASQDVKSAITNVLDRVHIPHEKYFSKPEAYPIAILAVGTVEYDAAAVNRLLVAVGGEEVSSAQGQVTGIEGRVKMDSGVKRRT